MDRPAPTDRPSLPWLAIAGVIAFSALLHARLWGIAPPDYDEFLKPWYEHILALGPVKAFSAPFGDYAPTYLYLLAAATRFDALAGSLTLIKTLSVLGTLFLASAVATTAKAAGARQPLLVGALVLVLPTPLLNAGLLAQCDALWTGCCLYAVASALRERWRTMLVWAGMAVAFKAQAVFVAPFVIGLLIRHRCPLHWWLIPPAIYALAMTPAWLAGWPAGDLATVYLRQAGQYGHVGTAANPWVVGRVFAPELSLALVPFGLMLGAASAVGLIWWTARARRLDLLQAALLSALLLPYVLPKIHERYFLLADMLAFVAAAASGTRRALAVAVLVNGASLLALIAYTQSTPTAALIGALLSSLALLLLLSGLARSRGDDDLAPRHHEADRLQ